MTQSQHSTGPHGSRRRMAAVRNAALHAITGVGCGQGVGGNDDAEIGAELMGEVGRE